jgi:hypothetical protein
MSMPGAGFFHAARQALAGQVSSARSSAEQSSGLLTQKQYFQGFAQFFKSLGKADKHRVSGD